MASGLYVGHSWLIGCSLSLISFIQLWECSRKFIFEVCLTSFASCLTLCVNAELWHVDLQMTSSSCMLL